MTRSILGGVFAVAMLSQISIAQDIPRPEHPTPDRVRPHWASLNGQWEFRFDAEDKGLDARWFEPNQAGFDRTIVVPFPWESELSGLKAIDEKAKIAWYRRSFQVPRDFPKNEHVWIKFGAVDYRADVWVNGQKVAQHEGGYTPFEADLTTALKPDGGENVIVVRAFDPTDPALPTGKQVGWYTTTSGIWQTVWLESRSKAFIANFKVTTEIKPARAMVALELVGLNEGETYACEVESADRSVNAPTSEVIAASDPRRDKPDHATDLVRLAVESPKLWSPESPHLYNVTLKLKDSQGTVVDSIQTYFGLRTIARGKIPGDDFERILLNGTPIYLRGALDQSFNPKGIYTAPSDEFLKQDILLAKSVGTNFLRIHIKPDEPRRHYWADRLGMLIMEDMPNTWRQNESARGAWRKTMEDVVARDQNHPSLFAWIDFNETWGLGSPPAYKKDTDTQNWVKSMVALTRKLDPTRLVEDNSPCNDDHVEGSDLNSWHFYIDDHDLAKKHIETVVKMSTPGSGFNYCPGQKMNSAPLINSEYGSISAGGGDRDVSWGFRDLTTQLRKHNKIQGYIYTELSDIEWEHNGFFDYDRSAKEFGYDAFVPGMTPRDLQGSDFVGYDAPPAIEATVGDLIRVPLFVSHYSNLQGSPKIRWWVSGTDGNGDRVELSPRMRPVEWVEFGVKDQKPLAVRISEPLVGAMAFVLEDGEGHKIAANFVNIVVRGKTPAPRLERLDDHSVAIRFAPGDFARSTWTDGKEELNSKVWGRGSGQFEYRLKLPESVLKARPQAYRIKLEAGAKAGRDQVDWNSRENARDNPQTDARKAPSTLEVSVNGRPIAAVDLLDDTADARGVLSHLARVEHGSFGEIITLGADLVESARDDLKAGKPLILRLGVPEDAEHIGGLAIFGAGSGAYPFDPTLIVETEDELPGDLGVKPDDPVATDIAATRRFAALRTGDSRFGTPSEWSFTTSEPAANWADPGFDASAWKRGQGGFGTPDTPALQERTAWSEKAIWLRADVELPALGEGDALTLRLFHDDDVEIFVNGKPIFATKGFLTNYKDVPLDEAQKKLFKPGRNLIAVKCSQGTGGQGIDVGLTLMKAE